ncbi:MAG: hypothetical protein ACLRWM_14675 [Streptococcus sp.]
MNANGGIAKEASRLNRELKDSEKERRKLEKNYSARKRLLQKHPYCTVKKANAIWGIQRTNDQRLRSRKCCTADQ